MARSRWEGIQICRGGDPDLPRRGVAVPPTLLASTVACCVRSSEARLVALGTGRLSPNPALEFGLLAADALREPSPVKFDGFPADGIHAASLATKLRSC